MASVCGGAGGGVVRKLLRHLPNSLSAFRLLAAPAVAWLILHGQDREAFCVFLLAGLSDALDGYLAKTFSLTSRFGAMLDPAADKLLMLASFFTLAGVGAIPWWLTAAVIGRDIAIVAGVLSARVLGAPLAIKPLIAGKASTVVQVAFVALVLVLPAFHIEAPLLVHGGVLAVILFALWSLLAYAAVWLRAVCTRDAKV